MLQTRTKGVLVAASLLAAAGLAESVWAQEAAPSPSSEASPGAAGAAAQPAAAVPEAKPAAAAAVPGPAAQPAPPPTPAPATDTVPPAPSAPALITFNFKDAPIDQVVDFFARESGLPVIFESPAPQGAITFVSASGYVFEDALSILNLNLARFGVHLRRQDQYLYLATMADSMKKPSPVATGANLEGASPDQIVTVSIPLDNAKAEQVAEQVKTLVGVFGGVIAVPTQNMIIVVETAAQVRRIREIITAIDSVRPADSAFRLFPLKHAQADAVLGALKGLVGERVVQTFVAADGKKTTVQDVSLAGLNLASDPRTNSIVAVGPQARIKVVEELITLLDVPESGQGEAQMLTFTLGSLSAEQAAAQINSLFASVDPKRKPTVLPLVEAGKITLIGSQTLLAQAASLLGEIDPGSGRDPSTGAPARADRRASTIALKYATPQAVETLATRLLTPRQLQVVKFAPTADGKGLIIAGPEADLTMFEKLVAALDVPPQTDKEVRLVRIVAADPAAVLARAQALYEQTGKAEKDPITATMDAESRTVTLIGSRVALAAFDQVLSSTQSAAKVDLEARTFEIKKSRPSELATKLTRLARPMLTPTDGSAYAEPAFDAVDELGTLIVRAEPAQFQVLTGLIAQLDSQETGGREMRVVHLATNDPAGLLARAQKLYVDRTQGMPADQAGPVTAELDERSGAVLITARPGGMRLFTEVLTQAQQLIPPMRITRVVDIHNVAAAKMAAQLGEMLAAADSIDPARKVPDPTIQPIERTNSLLVTAEEAQHRLVAEFVARLDKLDVGTMQPLKLLQLRTADAASIAVMLEDQYGRRPQSERSDKPVEVRADQSTNTLIVSSHPDLFEEIRQFVDDLNKDKNGPERVTQLFPLKVAKALDVAAAMDRLYPEPPVPVDRAGRPQPWLRKPKEVSVSAEANSNSLIIDATPDRMESLQELAAKLDRVELPPAAQLKTYRINGPSLEAVSKTLQSMSQRGIMSQPAQPGKQPVQVMIEIEPKSSTLIVAGDDRTFETVEKVLRELSLVPVEKGLRIIPIANEKATAVRERALAIYQAQVAQIPGANPIEVTVDESTNSLMVVADGEAMQRFGRVMEELQRQSGPAREVRLIEIKLAKASEVVGFLDDLVKSSESMMIRGGPEPVFEVIEATNTIMVAAQPGQFAVIESLVKSLDNREVADKPPMRILRLRSTDSQNLAAVLQRSYDARPVEQRGKMPVSIEADPGTNTLIVSAHADILPEIEAIVTQLNETQAADADGREIRIFPLKIARAEELAQTIDQMFPEPPVPLDPRSRQPRPDLKPAREVVVRADRATNSLIVDAPAKRLAGFEQLVKSLDQQKLADNVELRAYRIERADLNAVTATLKSLAAAGSLGIEGKAVTAPVTIAAEPATRTLIVSGPSEVFAAVDSVLAKLDAKPELAATEMKLYTLVNARSERLQPLIDRLLNTRAREAREAQGKSVGPEKLVEVTGDAASNTLIVSAPREVISIADGLVKALDQQSVSSAVEVRVFKLNKGNAASAATAVTAAVKAQSVEGEPAATISAEPSSNTVVVVGTAAQVERAGKLIESMDVSVDREGLGVRTIPLKHARAESIAPVLEAVLKRQSALEGLPDWARIQALSRGATELPQVRVAAEPRLNTIVVSGPLAMLDVAEQAIAELDADPALRGAATDRPVRIVTLHNADAAELAKNLEMVFSEEQTQDAPPTIRVDAASNSLIIRATDAQMTVVEDLTRRLDAAAVTVSRQMRMVPVDRSRVDAEVMAQTLRRLMEQQGGIKVEVISSDELLKGAAPREEPAPAEVPKKGALLDRSGSGGLENDRGFRSQRLTQVTDWRRPGLAGFVAGVVLLNTVGQAQPAPVEPAAQAPRAVDEGGITIAVDRASNSLMLLGSPRMTDRLARLIADLEKQMPAEPTGVRVVTLPTSVDADAVTNLLQQTVRQIGRTSAGNPGGFTGPVSVLPDPAGAALIILANDSDFETMRQLVASVAQLDHATPVTIKIYPLVTVTANRAITAVRDLFSAAPGGQQARRVRALDISMSGADGAVSARIDPATVRMTADPGGASIIVAAPQEAIPLIDRLIENIDQSPVKDRLAIRRYELHNARATELSRTLQGLFDAQRQGPSASDLPQARFVADDRTNSMLVTASDPQHKDIARLLETADSSLDAGDSELAIITLQQASASTVQRIVEEVVIGRDPAKKDRVRISAEDGSSLFVVRAPKEDVAQVREIVAQVDSAETEGLPVRSIKLERADAAVVATALQKFFTDRASVSSRAGKRVVSRVAVVGDRRTGTLIVSASDDAFEQVKGLVATFDSPTPAQDFEFKVIALKNARATEIAATIKEVVDELRWTTMFSNRANAGGAEEQLFVEANARTNSMVVIGRGEGVATVERVIAALDQPDAERAVMTIKSVTVANADLQALRSVLARAFVTPGWSPWRGADPEALLVEVDKVRRAVILVGNAERVEQAAAYIQQLDGGAGGAEQKIDSLTLVHARADRAAQSLRQFFTDRARAQGVDASPVSVIGSADGNVLMFSGDAKSLTVLRDLAAQIDQPDGGKDRQIEVYVLKNGTAKDTADVLRSMFARSGRGEEQVIITPQPSTNSLIVSAPTVMYDEVAALLKLLDAPPSADEANIETVALTSARAVDVATALRGALPANVKVTVTPVARSNSLLLTGSREAIALVLEQVKKIDTEPVRSGLVFRRFKIVAADASDVAYTIEQMLDARPRGATEPDARIDYSRLDNTLTVYAPADQIEEIDGMIRELDQPAGGERTTEFIKLEFANAEQTATALKVFYGRYAPEAATPGARSVTILPDPLSNSLVIRAEKTQWEGIRALLDKLDTKEYDTTRQLAVIPLVHADAVSVARALNDGLRAPLEEQLRQAQLRSSARGGANNRQVNQLPEATVLVDAEGVPTVSAEAQTNSLIVFAGRRELDRIQEIVKQLDVAGFADMPAARIIALKNGKPSTVATTIRDVFLNKRERTGGPRSVLVIGDDLSGALIVRADDEQFAQIKALAETLEQQGEIGRIAPHVVRLRNVAAGRLRQTLLATFSETAKGQGETLAIEVDRGSNALVIACSPRLLAEIQKVIDELDGAAIGGAPGPDDANTLAAIGQSVTIVDVVNNSPQDIRKVLEEMGLTRPQAADRPGVVSEAVTISTLTTRRALAIVASPADGRAVESLIRALDSAPMDGQQHVAVIPLKMASAKAVAETLTAMISPGDGKGQTGPAQALTEQVRRLSLSRNGVEQTPAEVDLAKPIRLMADVEANTLIIASTQANIDGLREIVKLIDTLPLGDAVIVRIFMLENSSAGRVKQVIDQLFSQGEELRRLPGTQRRGLPPTTTGKALAGEIAIAIDERTNAMIVAGRDEAVALVEVLVKDLDSDRASKWIEPMILPLKHADAATLARRLQEVLIRGLAATPETIGLQRQFGRLRMTLTGDVPTLAPGAGVAAAPDAGQVASPQILEADLFAPVTGLVISAEEQLNALLVVGTPGNNAVVKALVGMLDVEAASAANSVRVYPLVYAASDRVAGMLRDIFRQREQTVDAREEDRLILTSDIRTNSLIASSSPKSFAILEGLLKALDGEKSNFSVGLHVIPVSNADVKSLAPRIERLMRERIQAAAQAGGVRNSLDAFSIEPEPNSNLLIVAASDENLQVIRELVSALTSDAARFAATERVDIIQLVKSRAAEVAESLQSLYVERENARRGVNAVGVTANDRLNALIVTGNEQDMIELRALASRLDNAEVALRQQVKWIELKSANAPEVVSLLNSVLAGRPIGGGRGVGARQATRVQFLRERFADELAGQGERPPTEADIDGAIRDQVTLTPDARTNSVWISAPAPMVTLITEMIEDIERSSAGSRRIEHFQLTNADARQMAELLRDTFNLRQQGNSLVLVPTGPISGQAEPDPAAPASGFESATVTAVPDERQQLSIAVDARTNTLIVSGTEEYLDLVRKVVTDLDNIQARERERRVYHLRNAKANEIQDTLNSYFKNESDIERQTLGPQLSGSLMRRLEEEVTVVGDEKSNKLVISTSPRYMETVLKIIDELDAAPPQVMIQVLLAEVTLDSSETWGMDISAGPFGGDAFRIGTAAASAGVATSLGVPNLAVSSADFSVVVRALEAQGRLEVLSNPQVMVNNNQMAEIKVGEEIGVAGDTERGNTGNTIVSSVVRKDVGIILTVTPSISADGFVRMEIKPEISQLSAKTTQINRDQVAPVITQRSVDTIVTVKDGQSVVIGGLIQTSDEQRKTKIPILGDIPILGLPFRSKQDMTVKTELLVILTPRVIPGLTGLSEPMVQDVTDQIIDRLEDPSKISDHLERIKLEVKRSQEKMDAHKAKSESQDGRGGGGEASTRMPEGTRRKDQRRTTE